MKVIPILLLVSIWVVTIAIIFVMSFVAGYAPFPIFIGFVPILFALLLTFIITRSERSLSKEHRDGKYYWAVIVIIAILATMLWFAVPFMRGSI